MFQTVKSPIKVTGIPHSNGAYQENRKCKRCVEFHVDGVSLDCKELLGHLGSAGIGLDLKATCQEQASRLITVCSSIFACCEMAFFRVAFVLGRLQSWE